MPPSAANTLQVIKFQLGNPAALSSWASADACDGTYYGVSCILGAVTSLDLSYTQLSRAAPPEDIQWLRALKVNAGGLRHGQLQFPSRWLHSVASQSHRSECIQ